MSLSDLGDVRGRRVLVRSDLNVPLDGSTITDDGRIRASVSTIRDLTAAGARVVVMAHLGRPNGTPDPAYSLAPVAARLGGLLGTDIAFATDTKTGIIAVIFYVIYQQLENYVIYPRVMSKSVDVPGVVIVIAAVVGATLLGVIGALLAIPTAAAILLIMREVVIRRLDAT